MEEKGAGDMEGKEQETWRRKVQGMEGGGI